MKSDEIILLCQDTTSSAIVYNYLSQYYSIDKVIIEDAPPKRSILNKRIKKLGLLKVCGQVLFRVIINKLLEIRSGSRIAEIVTSNNLNLEKIPASKIIRVSSVNSEKTVDLLQKADEKIIVVNGTRIIGKNVLNVAGKTLINMHAGITPAYRGVHGAYWAYRNGEPSLAGVTIHYVDKGIDTGQVISQKKIERYDRDNFASYPYLQLAAGLPELSKAVEEIIRGNHPMAEPLTSQTKLYSHPTFFEYIFGRIFGRVK